MENHAAIVIGIAVILVLFVGPALVLWLPGLPERPDDPFEEDDERTEP